MPEPSGELLPPSPSRLGHMAHTLRRRDLRRAAVFNRLVAMGQPELASWRSVLTGPWGFPSTRGKPDLTDDYVAASLARHLELLAPTEVRETQALLGSRFRRTAMNAHDRIDRIIAGDFGQAKVKVGKDGETLGVGVDAAAAGVQVQAAKLAFDVVGLTGRKASAVPMTINAGNAQINLGAPLPPR